MQSVIQILKVNEVRKGISAKNQRPYELQDAECLLLTDAGEVDQVGVLQVPRELLGKVKPGTYTASFALRPNMSSRRIEAVLTNLMALPPKTLKPGA